MCQIICLGIGDQFSMVNTHFGFVSKLAKCGVKKQPLRGGCMEQEAGSF